MLIINNLNQPKKIAIGVDDFRYIRERDTYYVDKTSFIADVLETSTIQVKLITRPRRFGKTLNLSMLKYFFDIAGAEANRALFNGLEIENTPHMEHFGSYPVISLTLKGLKSNSFEDMLSSMRQLMAYIFRNYQFFLSSNKLTEVDLHKYSKILIEDEPNLSKALFYLCELLHRHYDRKVIVLIDEYDAPVISSYVKGYYNEAIDFFKGFMSSTFKTNEYLEMGIITGVSRISRESIFSDMNNVTVYSVLSDTFSERFGFTSEEVSEILNIYGYADKKDEVRHFYDGYRFSKYGASDVDIYNPLSILKYADSGYLEPYWVNTASDDLIKNIAFSDMLRFLETCEELLKGGSIDVEVEEGITFDNLNCMDDIWTLLLYSGYLTVERYIEYSRYSLRLPNEEVRLYFKKMLRDLNLKGSLRFELLIDLLFNDFEKFKVRLNEVIGSFSYFDLKDEADYHLVLVSLFLMYENVGKNGRYEVLSNRESGSGRPDIMVIDKRTDKAIIFELKHVKKADCTSEEVKQKKIAEALKDAAKQIAENKYGQDFSGEFEAIPLVACGKAFYFGRLSG